MIVRGVRCRTLVNRTGGFLRASDEAPGYTHTINPYHGCSLGGTLCGMPDYAAEIVKAFGEKRPWGRYLDAKVNAPEAYAADHDRIRRSSRPELRIFMASVTDPWVPQERTLRITRRILEAMRERPPDRLVLQTHTPHALWDADLLVELAARFPLVVQVSVETDRERFPPPIPPHAYPVAARLAALAELTARGIATVAVVAPLWPVQEPAAFAAALDAAARFVILDHYLLGDGSAGGGRTCGRLTPSGLTFPQLLVQAGFAEWTTLGPFERVRAALQHALGPDRIGISRQGFLRAAGIAGRAP